MDMNSKPIYETRNCRSMRDGSEDNDNAMVEAREAKLVHSTRSLPKKVGTSYERGRSSQRRREKDWSELIIVDGGLLHREETNLGSIRL